MKKIISLRKNIDKIDKKIIGLLIARKKVTDKIGQYKKTYNLPSRDIKREKEMWQKITKATEGKLSQSFVKKIFSLIWRQALVEQNKIIK